MTDLSEEQLSAEILKEKIRDLLRHRNIGATIDDSITANTTTTTDRDDE